MVKSIQAALFIASIDLTNKITVANELKSSLIKIFNGEPLILPIPDDAPPEIPIIILKSKDESFALNIARSRIDLFFKNIRNADISVDSVSSDLLALINDISRILFKKFSCTINRMGTIATLSLDKEDSVTDLVSHLDGKYFNASGKCEAQVHLLSKEDLGEYQVNNWVRVVAQDHEPRNDKLLVVTDINTQREAIRNYDLDKIIHFFKLAFTQIKNSTKLYAPINSDKRPN